jgi:hypothetical protein
MITNKAIKHPIAALLIQDLLFFRFVKLSLYGCHS